MLKIKKIALGTFSAIAVVAVPITAVVSCGETDKTDETDKIFDLTKPKDVTNYSKWLADHTKDFKLTASATLKFGGKSVKLEKGDTLKDVARKAMGFLELDLKDLKA